MVKRTTHEQSENFKMEDIKKCQTETMELKNAVTELKTH